MDTLTGSAQVAGAFQIVVAGEILDLVLDAHHDHGELLVGVIVCWSGSQVVGPHLAYSRLEHDLTDAFKVGDFHTGNIVEL